MRLHTAESGHHPNELNLKSGHLPARTQLLWGGSAGCIFPFLTGYLVLRRGLSVDRGGAKDRLLVYGALTGLDVTDGDGNSTFPPPPNCLARARRRRNVWIRSRKRVSR